LAPALNASKLAAAKIVFFIMLRSPISVFPKNGHRALMVAHVIVKQLMLLRVKSRNLSGKVVTLAPACGIIFHGSFRETFLFDRGTRQRPYYAVIVTI
jgi:hypothetical protein